MFQQSLLCGLVLILASAPALAQVKQVSACRRAAAAAVKPAPGLDYPCGAEGNDWDAKLLRSPARLSALTGLVDQLTQWTTPAWWETTVDELNACDSNGEADYAFWLFGDNQIRLVLLPDPCYQTQYGGSNAFLLYRKGDKVSVTQVLDGYFSRADNSVSLNFGKLTNELVVEIATGSGGLNPTLTNYYFVIDPVTNRAVPKNLFAGRHGPTNRITSAMLFSDVPAAATPLNIIRGRAFSLSFSVYTEHPKGKIDDNGRTLLRRIKRWDGKLYR